MRRKILQIVVAIAVLALEQGKVRLEDPVKKYVPDAPAAWDAITHYES